MCGIAGYTGIKIPGKIQTMADALKHRGPDEQGFYSDKSVELCIRRLSIIDIEGGSQPVKSQDENAVVVFNGEIYNYLELKQELIKKGAHFHTASDTEVVLRLYEAYGIRFIDKLNGLFAIAIWDKKKKTLFLIRDRLGKKFIYYAYDKTKKSFQFSSEFNALNLGGLRRFISKNSLIWYFSQKTMPLESTLDTRIQKVPPASYLSMSLGKPPKIHRYYELAKNVKKLKKSEPELIDGLESLLKDSVALRMRADVEVGAFLSGGLDSSLLTALASRLTKKPLKTYSLVYKEKIGFKEMDQKYARLVSERYHTDHTEVLLTPEIFMKELPRIAAQYGEPNSAVLANWFISKEMGKRLKVALSGDGADELFGSYFLHRVALPLALYAKNKKSVNLSQFRKDESDFIKQNANQPFFKIVDRFSVFTDQELAKLLKPATYKKGKILSLIRQRQAKIFSKDPLDRALEWDCKNALVTQILNYADMLGMAHSLEIRAPYLDYRLAEYAFSLDAKYKIRNDQTKYLLKKVGERYLPKELVHRPKEGFVEPSLHWIYGPMKDFAKQNLLASSFDSFGFLNKQTVKNLATSFFEEKFELYKAKKVWNLLMFALWERTL